MATGTSVADAVLARTRLITLLALTLPFAAACDEQERSRFLRPTPLTSSDWGPPPPGHHSLSGTVSEPDDQPVEGAIVSTLYGTAHTDSAGRFRLDRVGATTVDVRKDGYERLEPETHTGLATRDVFVDLVLPRIVRLEAGETYRATLYPRDVVYQIGDPVEQPRCRCKLIRIQVPSKGTVSVRAEWAGSQDLSLFLVTETTPYWPEVVDTGGRGSAIASIDSQGGEVLVYLGLGAWPLRQLATPVPFTMTTSIQ